MAAIDFPNSPAIDDTITVGDVTWTWTGTVWQSQGTAVPGPAGADGAQGINGEANFNSFMLMGA